jgi:phosphopantetheinyl transferase
LSLTEASQALIQSFFRLWTKKKSRLNFEGDETNSGLPDFPWNVHDTKTGKMYQMYTKCTKWS